MHPPHPLFSRLTVQVGDGALAGHDGLNEEAEHGEHSQTAVLDLLDLQLSQGIGVVSQTQGVEGTSGVQVVLEVTQGGARALHTVALNGTHQDDLDGDGGDDVLGVDQTLVAQVVQTSLGKDLGAGLQGGTRWLVRAIDGAAEGHNLRYISSHVTRELCGPNHAAAASRHKSTHSYLEPNAIISKLVLLSVDELGDDAAQSTQHGPTSVDHLDLAVTLEGLGIGGQTSSVPSVVSGELTLQVRGGGVLREGAQELGTVGSVELDGGLGHLAGGCR